MPMSRAMGIVQEMVKSPHGLSRSALTTTSASTASRMTMIAKMATIAARPATGFDLFLGDLSQRFAVTSHRGAEDHEVLHGSAEHDTGDEPQRAWQVPELRRERWTDQGTGAGDRREVVAEEHPLRRGDKVAAVVQPLGGRRARRRVRRHVSAMKRE